MKNVIKKISVLTIALIVSVLAMTSCALEKTANNLSSGGTEQAGSTSSENRQIENKAADNKAISGKEILWDFRKNDDYKTAQISKAETDAVMKYLFGEQAYPNLQISSRLSGSFTKPNAKETLYYISGCKDETTGQFVGDCPHSVWDTAAWIAIYDGTTPVMKIEEALGSNLVKVTDVNGDGKNEFLSFGGYAQSGIQTQGLSIGQISDGKYENIKGFNGYAYNCAFGPTLAADKKFVKVAVISYIPTTNGKMPDFSEEYFQANCKSDDSNSGSADDLIDKSSWKTITKKEFEKFFDSLS